jgi:hypothetical protein
MQSSGMLRRITLVRTDISEERSAYIIRVTRIGELEKLAVTSNRPTLEVVFLRSVRRFLVTADVPCSFIFFTLMTEDIRSSETAVFYKNHTG